MGDHGLEFFETPMGRQFFERTMPQLVEQLKELNKLLAQLIAQAAERPRVRTADEIADNAATVRTRTGEGPAEER